MKSPRKQDGKRGSGFGKAAILTVLVLMILFATRNQEKLVGRDLQLDAKTKVAMIEEDDFALAKRESMNFYDDVSSKNWMLKKQRVRDQSSDYRVWSNDPYWEHLDYNFQPDFSCDHERRIGGPGDGGKWVCDPQRIDPDDCLVYSIGSNNDFSFEKQVQQTISRNCEIHTFDMGDYAAEAREAGGNITYHQTAFGDGHKIEDMPTKSLSAIIKELGHEHRVIDVFKIDCEGCEYVALKNMLNANVTLRQIQMEIHGNDKNNKQVTKLFSRFKEHNYVMFHKEANRCDDVVYEFSFLKLDAAFFRDIDTTNTNVLSDR